MNQTEKKNINNTGLESEQKNYIFWNEINEKNNNNKKETKKLTKNEFIVTSIRCYVSRENETFHIEFEFVKRCFWGVAARLQYQTATAAKIQIHLYCMFTITHTNGDGERVRPSSNGEAILIYI